MQIGLEKSAVGREVNQQFVDLAESQHAAIELVIQQMAAALTIVGDEVFVIPGDVNPLHMLRGAKTDQYPFALVEAEHRLVVQNIGHRPVGGSLAGYGPGMGVAKMAVDMQGAEQIVGGDLSVDDLMQLLAVYRVVEADAVLRSKTRSSPRTVFFGPRGLCARCRRRAAGRPRC